MLMEKKYLSNVGPLLIIVLSVWPLYWWATAQPLAVRFGSTIAPFSFGQITALIGLALLSLALLLSARFYIFDLYFGGINRAYFFHYFFGALSLVLLMFHPLLLLARYLPFSLQGTMDFLLPGQWWQKDLGIYSLILLIVLVLWSVFFRFEYRMWKFGHKFLGVAFLIGGLHSFYISSSFSQILPLKIYMVALGTLGLCAYIYRNCIPNHG